MGVVSYRGVAVYVVRKPDARYICEPTSLRLRLPPGASVYVVTLGIRA